MFSSIFSSLLKAHAVQAFLLPNFLPNARHSLILFICRAILNHKDVQIKQTNAKSNKQKLKTIIHKANRRSTASSSSYAQYIPTAIRMSRNNQTFNQKNKSMFTKQKCVPQPPPVHMHRSQPFQTTPHQI